MRCSDVAKLTCSKAELAFVKCFSVQSADIVVSRIKARRLDAYEALDKFVGYILAKRPDVAKTFSGLVPRLTV